MAAIVKVTAFCIRGEQLLVFDHPAAGTQVPAGTVDPEEDPRDAALRELSEETGVFEPRIVTTLGVIETNLRAGKAYALQELEADDGRTVRRGLPVSVTDAGGQTRFVFEEWDFAERPPKLLDRREGTCVADAVTGTVRRHFFLCETDDERVEPWSQRADGWNWTVRWAKIDETLHLSGEQHGWLRLLHPRQN